MKEHGVPPFTDEVFCPACRTVFPGAFNGFRYHAMSLTANRIFSDTRHYSALRNLESTADLGRVDHLPPRLKYDPISFAGDEDLGPPTSDTPIFADLARIVARMKELEERKSRSGLRSFGT